MRQHVPHALGLMGLHRMQGADGEDFPVGNILLQQEHAGGDDNRDDGNSGGQVFGAAQFAEEFLIHQHGQRDVVFADEHGGAVVGKRAHEHQQRPGQQGGQHQGQHHLEYLFQPGAAKAFAGLDQAVVHALERAGNEHEHQAVQLEAHHDHAALEPVNVAQADADAGQQVGHDPVAAAQLNPGVGADEGSGHGGYKDQDLQHARAFDFHGGHDVGHGRGDEHGHQGDHRGNQQRMPDGVAVIGAAENLFIHFKGQMPFAVQQRLAQQHIQRIHQEYQIENDRQHCHHGPHIMGNEQPRACRQHGQPQDHGGIAPGHDHPVQIRHLVQLLRQGFLGFPGGVQVAAVVILVGERLHGLFAGGVFDEFTLGQLHLPGIVIRLASPHQAERAYHDAQHQQHDAQDHDPRFPGPDHVRRAHRR